MYTTGEIAAELCLEKPGLDTLDIAVFWGGSPTIASTQTILVNAATSRAHHLQQNQYVEFDPTQGLVSLVVPGQHELALSLPWGGTSHPVWYRKDPRVANCKAQGGVFNAALMNGVPQIVAGALEATKDMTEDERDQALTATAAQVMNQMPPRENPRLNKSLDSVHASGPLGRAHCVIHGNQNYKQTGLLQAYAAYSLLQQPPLRVGLRLGLQGVRPPRAARAAAGVRPGRRAGRSPSRAEMRLVDYLDKGASLGGDAPCLRLRRADVDVLTRCGTSPDSVASALAGRGVRPGDKVAILSSNDPVAFTCVFGISRAGAVWCPINPRNEADGEPRAARPVRLHGAGLPGLLRRPGRPDPRTTCRRSPRWSASTPTWSGRWAGTSSWSPAPPRSTCRGDATTSPCIVGTGGTTGRPKGVMLTGANIETMTAHHADRLPVARPAGPADVPRARAAHPRRRACSASPCWPRAARSSSCAQPDVAGFLANIGEHRVTHTFLPPTLIYMVLDHPDLATTDLSSAAVLLVRRRTRCRRRGWRRRSTRIGPVMAQLFGQTEAPMMISTMAPADHFRAGRERRHTNDSHRRGVPHRW